MKLCKIGAHPNTSEVVSNLQLACLNNGTRQRKYQYSFPKRERPLVDEDVFVARGAVMDMRKKMIARYACFRLYP